VKHPEHHTAIMLDGFYIAYPSLKMHRHLPGARTEKSILLLAIDAYTHQPLHWAIYPRLEDARSWSLFFAELTHKGFTPQYLIHDGHYGLAKAVRRYMPDVLNQRCLVHMIRNVHKDIGIMPKAPLAQVLQTLIYQLVHVHTQSDKDTWEKRWRSYLAEYTLALEHNFPMTKAFLGLHVVLYNAHKRNELFVFLEHSGIPNNTNAIESQNRVLREALTRHRGMSLAKRQALIAWILLFRSEPDLQVIRAHYLAMKHTLFDT
jgi:transposase-like protein